MCRLVWERSLVVVLLFGAFAASVQTPLGTAFTYQGRLKEGGSPADGSFNMEFRLFDALSAGNQVGPTLTFDGVGGNPPSLSVADGLFTVELLPGAPPAM